MNFIRMTVHISHSEPNVYPAKTLCGKTFQKKARFKHYLIGCVNCLTLSLDEMNKQNETIDMLNGKLARAQQAVF